jgi:hypothetical protein
MSRGRKGKIDTEFLLSRFQRISQTKLFPQDKVLVSSLEISQ